LRAAGKASQRQGLELFLVGGTVRDLLLGRRPHDLDLSAVGLTEARVQALAGELGGRVTARSQFGTAKLDVGGSAVDVAMARKESYSAPGALPDVSPGSTDDDLARRDFTINAMAVSLTPDSWGTLIDPHDGRRDLESRLVRVLHTRSFVDDATRILRAVRYSARLDFRIEPATLAALLRDLGHIDAIKGDRVRHELERIFDEGRATAALAMARDLGALRAIDPALAVEDGTLERLSTLSGAGVPDKALLFLSALAYPLSRSDTARLMVRLNLDSRWARAVRDSLSINESAGELRSPGLRPRRLNRLLHALDPVAVQGAMLAVSDSVMTEHLQLYLDELRHVTTILNGDDLMAMGVPEGPTVGRMLDELLAARLEGLLATREDEEAFVVRRVASGLDPG
jgi:tRNA nucleotidyltransferase (CCA-adding enzyme)